MKKKVSTRQKVLNYFEKSKKKKIAAKEIREKTGLDTRQLSNACWSLSKEGVLKSEGFGIYSLVKKAEPKAQAKTAKPRRQKTLLVKNDLFELQKEDISFLKKKFAFLENRLAEYERDGAVD